MAPLSCRICAFCIVGCIHEALAFSLLGCPGDAQIRQHSQRRMRRLLWNLMGPKRKGPSRQELESLLGALMTENSDTSRVILQHSQAQAYQVSDERPLPCMPGILTIEFLQLLWIWKKQLDAKEASSIALRSDGRWRFLRTSAWLTTLKLGYGVAWAAGHALCPVVPRLPRGHPADLEELARQFHVAWPGSTATEATIFKQFHSLAKFDYRDCARRFVGGQGPAVCRSSPGGKPLQEPGARWPHRQFLDLMMRQDWACGVVCRYAAAFAYLAEAWIEGKMKQKKLKWSEDQQRLIESAQAQILLADSIFWSLLDDERVQLTCSLIRSFPIFILLARLAGLPMSLGNSAATADELAMISQEAVETNQPPPPLTEIPKQPPPPPLAKLCDVTDTWPPVQRLTPQGAVAMYSMVHNVGRLLDHFGVRWWMSSGSLLGTLRNGGMLPQDCDVDIAIWRGDAYALQLPAFQAALHAAGLVSFHMPIYFQYRFCLMQVPAGTDARSVHGGLACLLPFVDAHLADVASSGVEWNYIHRTELQYAKNFPLGGIFTQDAASRRDQRQRSFFGDAEVWIPRLPEAEDYLTRIYGGDWRFMVRGRQGKIVYNLSKGESFWGMIVRPTGPLRDVLEEQRLIGSLLPGAAVTCTDNCDRT